MAEITLVLIVVSMLLNVYAILLHRKKPCGTQFMIYGKDLANTTKITKRDITDMHSDGERLCMDLREPSIPPPDRRGENNPPYQMKTRK